jgi:sialic acid synthase SpsE
MPTQFVAEVSGNHNRDLDRCFEFIDVAAEIGCDAIKFQLFKVEELFAPEILDRSEEHRRRKEWELPVSFLPELYKRCNQAGIQFACTPFYLNAVEELRPYVSFYKIASYELLWEDLLKAVARTAKPVVLSTGMAALEEIHKAVDILGTAGCNDLTLLHCVSAYPTPVNECNLAAIETLQNEFRIQNSKFKIQIGWSDHSVNSGVIYRAVHRWDAFMIEFHLDLDGKGEEFVSGHCWLPEDMGKVIRSIKEAFEADGSGIKEPMPMELPDREWRADPSDGLRPLLDIRKRWVNAE